jgi:dihydrofolate synthase/folylpolyglutamate synthase
MTEAANATQAAYQEALDFLYSFINYENRMPPSRDHARFNLQRMRWFLRQLGEPQLRWKSVVVAGTKGKGSTAAMIEAILRAAGCRTGLYSSPHLHSWRERVQVNRELISQADAIALTGRLKQLVADLPADLERPTTFELTTALAFEYFARSKVDVAVLEVGMGGRYDTVNVVTPSVSAITPISFDHMAILGNTLGEIAWAKAGIIKPGVPVVTAPQAEEALQVIRAEAGTQSPLWLADGAGLRPLANADGELRAYPVAIDEMTIGLRGRYQVDNARTAAAVAMLLQEQGLHAPTEAMAEGLATARWPGRFEVVPGTPPVVIDGAMNRASAARLREALGTLRYRRLILVLGTSQDKDVAAIAAELAPHASCVVLTRSRHPRSADPEALAAAVEPFFDGPMFITDDVPPAVEKARELAGDEDLICVAGSLFVAAAARETLGLPAIVD